MSPAAYGAVLARSTGDEIEVLRVESVIDVVGESEAVDAEVPFWAEAARLTAEDLDPEGPYASVFRGVERDGGVDVEGLDVMDRVGLLVDGADVLESQGGGFSRAVLPDHPGAIEWLALGAAVDWAEADGEYLALAKARLGSRGKRFQRIAKLYKLAAQRVSPSAERHERARRKAHRERAEAVAQAKRKPWRKRLSGHVEFTGLRR